MGPDRLTGLSSIMGDPPMAGGARRGVIDPLTGLRSIMGDQLIVPLLLVTIFCSFKSLFH
jgi:hypothetical protein